MLSWVGRFLSSSIGKKAAMALTGLGLVGFLVVHLLGNLTLYADDTGEAFNHYAETLEANPFLPVAEIGLALLFAAHIALAVRVTAENREARRQGYRLRASMGERTLASATMIVTGVIVLVFLVVHVADFRIPKLFGRIDDLAAAVKLRLASPLGAGIYLVGVGALGIHLAHAFKSAFQSLGLNHPRFTPLIARTSVALAVLLFLGFVSFPVVLLAA